MIIKKYLYIISNSCLIKYKLRSIAWFWNKKEVIIRRMYNYVFNSLSINQYLLLPHATYEWPIFENKRTEIYNEF